MINVIGNLYRGPRPDLTVLQQAGIKTVINLESGIYDFFNTDTYKKEEQNPKDFGIQLIHIPLSDFTPPKASAVSLALQFMKCASANNPTYVHCFSGVDRTGFVCASYRMDVEDWDKEKAIAEMKALGMHWWYYWWTGYLR